MQTTTTLEERIEAASLLDFPSTALVASHEWEQQRRAPLTSRRLTPLLLMAAGLAVLSVAAVVLIPRLASASGEGGIAASRPARALGSRGVAIGGPGDVAAQIASYAPGQTSAWHSHTGLHAIVVMSGTLTIVDGECRRHTFGPGDSYVEGRDVHLALNETAAPLEMAVTYMFPAGVSHTGFHVAAAAPSGCEIR